MFLTIIEAESELVKMADEITTDAEIIKEDLHEHAKKILEGLHDDPLLSG